MKTLIYLGVNHGGNFASHIQSRLHDEYYGFEAQPALALMLQQKYSNNPNVNIIHAAVGVDNEPKDFYVQNANTASDGAASSLGVISQDYLDSSPNHIILKETVRVPGISLPSFLASKGISEIETYISDIQGMDYIVLSTLKDFIDTKRIKNIQVEAECDYKRGRAYNLPYSNKTSLFHELLDENYDLASIQQGGCWDPASPEAWWHRDLWFKVKG